MASESETLRKDVEELRTSLDRLNKDVGALSQSLMKEVKERASRTADDLRSNAQSIASEIGVRGRESAEAVEKTVREHPLQSLLIAFGAGMLLAQLTRRH